MNGSARPQTTPLPPAQSSRRRVWLLGLLLLLLLAGGAGGALWWRARNTPANKPDEKTSGEGSRRTAEPGCSDDYDPKFLEPLEFGPPIEVSYERRYLAALAKLPIPEVEIYPWQPRGLVAVLGEHRMRGTLIANSPDGKTLAVSSTGSPYIRIGPMETLHETTVLAIPGGARVLLWSPSGNRLAVSCGDGQVRLYDLSDLEKIPAPVLLQQPGALVLSLSFSGDGKYLLGGDQTPQKGVAYVWDVASRKIVSRLAHTGPVMGVAFSPVPGDYRAVTAGGREDGQLHLWDALTGREILNAKKLPVAIDFRPNKEDTTVFVAGVAYAPDGRRVLSMHPDGLVRVWDLNRFEKDRELHAYGGHHGAPLATFSPDGKHVATARYKDGIYLWEGHQSKLIRRLAQVGGVSAMQFLPGDRFLYAGARRGWNVHLHEVKTSKEILPPFGHRAAVQCVALSPEGQTIASGGSDQTIRLWVAEKGTERHLAPAGNPHGLGFHPQGKRIYFYSLNTPTLSFIESANASASTPPYSQAHSGGIYSAALTRDGRYAVTGGYQDGSVRMYRIQDGMQVRYFNVGQNQGPAQVTVAPDMRRAIRVGGSATRLLQLRCQEVVHEWPAPLPGGAPFLPDGRALFLAGPESPTWHISKEAPRAGERLKLNLAGLGGAALSHDGKRIAGLSAGRVVVHQLTPPRLVWDWAPPPHFGGVRGVALSADGGHLLTANGDGTVYVVRLP